MDTGKMLGQVVNNRYSVISLLGKGGSGLVYKAEDVENGRLVALKLFKEVPSEKSESAIRFEKEVAAAAKLSNEHTVDIYEFGRSQEGFLFMAMEYLDGRPLTRVIAADAPFSCRRAVHVVEQTLHALAEAHRAGIVHRDLKPDNIFLLTRYDDPEFVKVLDFGIAKFMRDDSVGDTLSRDGFVFGTPLYISPEQALGWQVSPASDIYSLGVAMFEMLAGYPPFAGETPIGLGMKHVYEPAPIDRLQSGDEACLRLRGLLARMLEKRPDRRPQSADAALELLSAVGAVPDIPFAVAADQNGETVGPGMDLDTIKARPVQTPSAVPVVDEPTGSTVFAEPAAVLGFNGAVPGPRPGNATHAQGSGSPGPRSQEAAMDDRKPDSFDGDEATGEHEEPTGGQPPAAEGEAPHGRRRRRRRRRRDGMAPGQPPAGQALPGQPAAGPSQPAASARPVPQPAPAGEPSPAKPPEAAPSRQGEADAELAELRSALARQRELAAMRQEETWDEDLTARDQQGLGCLAWAALVMGLLLVLLVLYALMVGGRPPHSPDALRTSGAAALLLPGASDDRLP